MVLTVRRERNAYHREYYANVVNKVERSKNKKILYQSNKESIAAAYQLNKVRLAANYQAKKHLIAAARRVKIEAAKSAASSVSDEIVVS
jgi:TATA-box binding protein (TBP) (component of TFIID and TFIIIB)